MGLTREQVRAYNNMLSIVSAKGGTVITGHYLPMTQKYRIQCSNKHEFKMTGNYIRNGRWCPECNYNETRGKELKKRTLREIADKRGTPVTEINKSNDSIVVKCLNSHEFVTTPSLIHSGFWCKCCDYKMEVEAWLIKNNIEYGKDHVFHDFTYGDRYVSFSFFVPVTNRVIDVSDFKYNKNVLAMKESYCKKRGIDFVHITPYVSFSDLNLTLPALFLTELMARKG